MCVNGVNRESLLVNLVSGAVISLIAPLRVRSNEKMEAFLIKILQHFYC